MSTSNIDTSTNLTSDVYGINSYVNEIKKRFTPNVNEDTLLLGIYGYMGQIFSDMYQNLIVMTSEFANESIPTKAKFEKNIIAHALSLGIEDINATPAQMDVLLTFVEDDINNWASASAPGTEGWTFIFDKDTPIYIGDYPFYVDYDIELRKIPLSNAGEKNRFAYTAKYLIDIDNPISDISNPYLTSPVKVNMGGTNVIFTKCTLHQVNKSTVHKKILNDNSIASKTTTFEFEGQLAAFTIDVVEGDKTIHLIPVYDGLSAENKKYPYFYYSYLDSNTIRIKFDKSSYAPRINSDLTINIQTTEGESGNFTYRPDIYPSFSCESEKYGYSNIGCEIRPVTGDSAYGANKKSISDLKQLIPKEASSRGSITNLSDLENYFNSINTDNSVLYLYKKRDNALYRLYYTFMIMRDALNNIIPTNTIDIRVNYDQLQSEDSLAKFVLKKGQIIRLTGNKEYGEVYNKEELLALSRSNEDVFDYIIPYNFILNSKPLYGMYYLSVIDSKKFLDFSYINDKCMYQYIATSITMYRGHVYNPDTYELTINIEQNIDDEANATIVEINKETGEIENVNILCLAVFYQTNDRGEDEPIRWASANFINYNKDANVFTYRFNFDTKDYIDINNKIRIDTGVYSIGSNVVTPAYLNGNTKCVIHILSKQGDEYGLNGLDELIPNLEGYTLSNSYTVVDGVDFFYDYSDIINSTVTVNKTHDGQEYFLIKDVPVVKHDYFNTEDKVIDFCKELVKRKTYINYAVDILEDAFGMDFKFVNTYGPSKLFTTDNLLNTINRTNLSFKFKAKLSPGYDTNILNDIIADIKTYIEDINNITSIHMPNLITQITNSYRDQLVYFEFIDMNGYGPSVQHMYSMGMPAQIQVPEFLNINTRSNGTPDIEIILE